MTCAVRCSSSLVASLIQDMDLKSILPDDMFKEQAERALSWASIV